MNTIEKALAKAGHQDLAEELVGASGQSVMDMIISANDYDKLFDAIKDDNQSQDLVDGIAEHFEKALTLKSNEFNAFKRFLNLLKSKSRSQEGARNQIFKVADELKIKLPSHMF